MVEEPSLVGAVSATDQVVVSLQVDAGISITSPSDTTMSTNLGVAVNTAVGTTTWNVKTNNNLGYTLAVKASTNPAMQSATNLVDDYSTSTVPTLWNVTTGHANFGFSAFGTDVDTGTWGSGSFCNGSGTSTVNTTLKYFGFYTTDKQIATRSSTTTPSGVDATVCFAVEQDGMYIPSGIFTATITATATTL